MTLTVAKSEWIVRPVFLAVIVEIGGDPMSWMPDGGSGSPDSQAPGGFGGFVPGEPVPGSELRVVRRP